MILKQCLLKIDHMRDRCRYARNIYKFCDDCRQFFVHNSHSTHFFPLDLRGVLVRHVNNFLLLVEGEPDRIRRFLTRMRTENVDVDSKGVPCRERMMDVISEREFEGEFSFRAFQELPQALTIDALLASVEAQCANNGPAVRAMIADCFA